MLVAKAWYGTYFAALSCVFPFVPLYFRLSGLDEQQIGLLAALRPWLSLPAGALWSGLADKSRRHRAVLLLTFAGGLLARLGLAAAQSFAALAALSLLTEFFAAPVTIIVDSAVLAACSSEGDYGRQRLWGAVGWGVFAAVAGALITHAGIYSAFICHGLLSLVAAVPTALLPLGPLHAKLDAQTHRADEDKSQHRSCGSAADSSMHLDSKAAQPAAATAVARGEGADAWSHASRLLVGTALSDSASSEVSMLLASSKQKQASPPAAAGPDGSPEHSQHDIGSRLEASDEAAPLLKARAASDDIGAGQPAGRKRTSPEQTAPEGSGGSRGPRLRFWQSMRQLLSNPQALLFFCQALLIGYGVGNIEGYLFLYLDELGGSAVLMGLSLSVTCAAESLVFYFFPVLLEKLGINRCLHLVFVGFVVRLGCYATLRWWGSPWLVLPVETLHGLTFALAWAAGTAYCGRIAPPGVESTCQSIFQGLMFGAGHGFGGLVGGIVYKRLGAQAVYVAACGVMVAGWTACSMAQLVLAARSGKHGGPGGASLELVDV